MCCQTGTFLHSGGNPSVTHTLRRARSVTADVRNIEVQPSGWTGERNTQMRVRKTIGSVVAAVAAAGALSLLGGGLASAAPIELQHGDDGLTTYDFGVDGQDVIVGGTGNFTWP